MDALCLKPLDDQMARMGCCYVRYMDDWVVLAPTRWKLRAAIRTVNQVMAKLGVLQHPDKTSIGRIQRGFDFLGYHFSTAGFAVARRLLNGVPHVLLGFMSKVWRYAASGNTCGAGDVG